MTTLSSRQTLLLVFLFVITSVTFISLDNRAALDPVKTGLRDLVVPVTNVFNEIGDGRDNSSDLERELERVKAERDAAVAENIRLTEENKLVEQLQSQLNVQEQHPDLQYVTAQVINPDPANLQKFITIDKGSADGIEVGMAVVDPNNFVGQVTEPVEEHSARVTLIIDGASSVGVQLQESGAIGILRGMWQQGGRADMQHVDRATDVKEGDVVITATNPDVRTTKVPGALPVGRVVGEPTIDNQNDTMSLEILPAADFDNLKVVSVIVTDDTAGS